MFIEKLNTVEQGLGRFSSIFSDSYNLNTFMTAVLTQVEESEIALLELAKQKDIDTISGVWLDYLGYLVGLPRAGRGDQEYREALQIKIAINRSDGTAPIVRDIVSSYTNSSRTRVAEGILSYGQIVFNGEKNANNTLWQVVQDIKPVTTKVLLVQDTEDKCIFLAWETGEVGSSEVFEVESSENVSPLEVALSEDSVSRLFINRQGAITQYDPDTTGSMVPEWENPEEITFNDGSLWNFRVSELELLPVEFVGMPSAVLNNTLLPWEIDNTSVPTPLDRLSDFEYFNGEQVNTLYVTSSTEELEKLKVKGAS